MPKRGDSEIRNDSLYENLSGTPDAGTFTRSVSADMHYRIVR